MQERKEVSIFPAGGHKTARIRQDRMTDKHETQISKRIHSRSTVLEQSVRKLPWASHVSLYQPHSYLSLFKIAYCRKAFQIQEGGKDQESIQSSTTNDPGHRMGK